MSIRHALLALLVEAPTYGLQLQHLFEERTGDVWPLNIGQVYTTLQRLERDDLVTSDGDAGGPQKRFRITAEGRAELDRWLRTPSPGDVPPRDELVIKVLVAARVPGADVRAIVQAHRRDLVERMQRFTRMKATGPPDDIGLALVLDAELFRLEGTARWLDAAEARLDRHSATTPRPAESGRTGGRAADPAAKEVVVTAADGTSHAPGGTA